MPIPTSTTSAAEGTVLNFNPSPTDIERGAVALIGQETNVSTNMDVRDASMAAEEKLNAFEIESMMGEDVYKAVRAVFDNKSEVASLGPEDRQQLIRAGNKFNRNIKGSGKIVFTRDELEGLSSDFFEGRATEVVDGQEEFVVTTKYPDIIPVMKMAKREETRERMFVVEEQRCPYNISIMQEAVALRLEAAQLLGYRTYVEFVLEENMARAPAPVLEFEEDLRLRLNVLADKEIEEIEALKKADKQAVGKPYTGLFGLVMERKHNINDEEVKQYFPVKEVTRSILDIYQNMLSPRFVKIDNPPVWHADIEMYEVWEATEETFYPIVAMVSNFPKPTPSAPALLTHDDATTLLHELGHVFHGICSVTKWALFHGTRTEREFVEAPSQMLDNWSWEPSVPQKFAVHHQTGEPIPEALAKRLVAAKNEGAGLFNLRQLFFGLYDMGIHNTADGKVDVKELYNKLYEDIARFKIGSHDTWGIATIGHMTGGYDAGYYGYMWSQVFSADMYASRFVKDGVFNPQTGLDYRYEILRPGSSRDAMDSLIKFMGHKPDSSTFLKSIGLDKNCT
ncbi:metalloendopeptidase [Coemansia sp. S146]|nr:metalloendopeptidase [Coemansia sp. S146]